MSRQSSSVYITSILVGYPLVLRALVDAGLGFLAKVRKLAAISCQCVGTLAVSAYAQDPNEEKIATREAAWAEVKSDQEQIRDSDSPRSQEKLQVIDSSQSPARFGQGRPSSRPSPSFSGQVLLALLLLLLCPSADAAGVICHKYGHLTGPPSGLPVVWDVNHSGVPRHGFVGLNHVGTAEVLVAAYGYEFECDPAVERTVPGVGLAHAERDASGRDKERHAHRTRLACTVRCAPWQQVGRLGSVNVLQPGLWECWLLEHGEFTCPASCRRRSFTLARSRFLGCCFWLVRTCS